MEGHRKNKKSKHVAFEVQEHDSDQGNKKHTSQKKKKISRADTSDVQSRFSIPFTFRDSKFDQAFQQEMSKGTLSEADQPSESAVVFDTLNYK